MERYYSIISLFLISEVQHKFLFWKLYLKMCI
ncbi:unnamed protein product [Larinioides sclopetarius]|uniref:Uncharacterized protein n=1 Tax=Larinioides sclopetarius TaxID=280406 RepID=A0AAV2A8S9_9ARAC